MKEDRIYSINHFEKFLKEKSDEFTMYPSKRVWHSVYNNLHPGRKWPSIAMCIFLLSCLLMIGYLNSSEIVSQSNNELATFNQNKRINKSVDEWQDHNTPFIQNNIINTATLQTVQTPENITSEKFIVLTNNTNNNKISLRTNKFKVESNNVSSEKINSNFIDEQDQGDNNSLLIKISDNIPSYNTEVTTTLFTGNAKKGKNLSLKSYQAQASNKVRANGDLIAVSNRKRNDKAAYELAESDISNFKEDLEPINLLVAGLPDVNSWVKSLNTLFDNNDDVKGRNQILNSANADKDWVEQYAMDNRLAPKKWKGKLGWQFYISSSILSRNLDDNSGSMSLNSMSPLSNITNNSDVNKSINHTFSYGLEVGATLQYPISKRLKIKSGLQINYNRYTVNGFENFHPIATSLTMIDSKNDNDYEVFRTTPYSNNIGLYPVKLHNQTVQLSIPVGIDLKIAGTDRLQWYAGASLQPTFVVGGKSYILSTDRKNYIEDHSLLNKLNLNANFETFISYKLNNYAFQFGPQFRQQLYSTNTKLYSIEERYSSIGIKVGVNKIF